MTKIVAGTPVVETVVEEKVVEVTPTPAPLALKEAPMPNAREMTLSGISAAMSV